jgi:hypothetical protein
VEEDDLGVVRKHPLTIDLSENQYGVRLDLLQPESSINITINTEIADEVKTVQDSPHSDELVGNNLGNFFTCSGGSDYLQGNGGQDTYVIEQSCNSVAIQNYDVAADND